jgi:hypothetical protein
MNLIVSSQFLTAVSLKLGCYAVNELETVCSAAIWVNVRIVCDCRCTGIMYNKNCALLCQLMSDCYMLSSQCCEPKQFLSYECANLVVRKVAIYRVTFNGNSCYIKYNTRCDMLLILMIISVWEAAVFMPALFT